MPSRRLPSGIEGLVHISELTEQRWIDAPGDVVEIGDVVPVRVEGIERDKQRIALSLSTARRSAEDSGWEFDALERVVALPVSAREEFPDECAAADGRYSYRMAALTRSGAASSQPASRGDERTAHRDYVPAETTVGAAFRVAGPGR